MQEFNNCHHRYSINDENFTYTPEDGIEFIVVGNVLQKSSTCGHVDSPISSKETTKINLHEKRNYPHSPKDHYVHIIDLL
ncbi:hypothetical protein [Bacillus massilinigeriensis]|uniref:hypothetical protein n=1 Tax=Bacillus massilionigeriensis TaxID=1805475 RepID=UPI00096B4941|nr:hypothetical protein [Bacillus massilionigeriensis]